MPDRQRRGVFITFEGPEGSGKSSQSRWLVRRLRRLGYEVVWVRDPGSTSLGRWTRRVLLHTRARFSPMAEALLFIGGRVQLVEELIEPSLRQGTIVVCDRFHDATVAYQGFGGALDVSWLNRLGRCAIHHVMPQVTILLDLPVGRGFARLRRMHDRMERKTVRFHQRVRRGYLTLARREPRRFAVLDASQAIPAIRRQIEALVLRRLGRRSIKTSRKRS